MKQTEREQQIKREKDGRNEAERGMDKEKLVACFIFQ